MNIQRIAAFSNGTLGGNPAGVVIGATLPSATDMQTTARTIGYAETAFACPDGDAWQVRYYSPEHEVAFCGHATIALGGALGQEFGAGRYDLNLSQDRISVSVTKERDQWHAELVSPRTQSHPLNDQITADLLAAFDLTPEDLDLRIAPRLAFAGVHHAILPLADRAKLAAMAYEFEPMQAYMQAHNLTTVSLVHIETPRLIHSRNAFAIGGVIEDPATGAAAAALGGALVDIGWDDLNLGGSFTIHQGDDMGMPSRLLVTVSGESGASVRVGGQMRPITHP
ncbi:oxidoreductase [Amylibacter marinus]|uniref:Oxidoreductase n=1 Tax=Amylibacter marinus TaxID=1475483 RepID=A0ABQ5VWT8_9RHOB|nr:PhzF family phenazine biosynthesis protein [Amylibacter marinus]GLQ35896.1 oxidoreductase [Amylibacter marinus]